MSTHNLTDINKPIFRLLYKKTIMKSNNKTQVTKDLKENSIGNVNKGHFFVTDKQLATDPVTD